MNEQHQPRQQESGGRAPGRDREGDEMLTIAEVAALVRVPVATLRYWRHLGAGPASFRIGRFVRYWRADVWAWIDAQTRQGRVR